MRAEKESMEANLREAKIREIENLATIKTLRQSITESSDNTKVKNMKVQRIVIISYINV